MTYPIIIREELSTSMAGLVSARWGLVPGWARDVAAARHRSTPAARPSRLTACSRKHIRRAAAWCPSTAIFEWQKLDASGKKKQPYAIAMKSESPLLWRASGKSMPTR
ncbi:SOS response-associated peptidase family protein [Mesorhizobium salmacidum]|uniref:SOS response-associated peptidase family protein n=1 Tax=Mesorhizobium salmacidum TaxID=3015171 RepID=UPI0039F5428E